METKQTETNQLIIAKQKSKKKLVLVWVSLLVVLFMVAAAFIVELPYYIEFPGGMASVNDVLTVDGKKDEEDGSYNYTYVSIGKATASALIYAWATPYTDIYSEKEMTGGTSDADFARINQFYMETSQNMAEYQALTLAGEDISLDYLGVYVLQVTENSTFQGVLNIADTVTGVNGETFKSSKELIDYVSAQKLGSKVSVTYQTAGVERTEEGKIIKLENGKNGIGIGLTDHTKVSSSHDIAYKTEGLGGPSAGLIFTLSIYTQVKDPELRNGQVIAGTGTIEEDGSVGDVGGVDKKIVAAAQSGATIFFVPDNPVDKAILKENPEAKSNYQEAKETAKAIKTDMKIVPVKTAKDAIAYLEKLNS